MKSETAIRDIEITRHRLPVEVPFPASWDPKPLTSFEATIVRVTADNGAVGIGSGDAMIGFERFKDIFIGQDPFDLERHNRALDSISLFASRCWPLDLALWDLRGKIENKPVYQLLGGTSDRIPVYGSTGTVRPAKQLAEQARMLKDRGFEAMKFRIGRRARGEDAEALRAVRQAVGGDIRIMVDANQAWRMPWDDSLWWTFHAARAAIEELVELDLYWVEEPLHRGDFDGLRRLRQVPGFPRIASGEMNTEYYELRHMIHNGCVDVLQTDCAYFGGITGLAKIAHEAAGAGVMFSPHAWGNGIGFLANAQLVAGTVLPAYLEYSYDPPEWDVPVRDFMLAEPVNYDGSGHVVLSDLPGLGFELDEDRLKHTRIT